MDGKFTIEAAQGEVLRFTFIGYEPSNITVGASGNINVSMSIETKGLEEVVVVGYGTQKKSLVTGAIAKVGGEDLAKAGGTNISAAMQGKTAGVQISSNSGQPGSVVSVTIRGIGTNGNAEPLYIVDGLPTNGNGIDYLSPSDIESIEVLKDAASGAIYGARAANGVVLITTKSGKKGNKFEVGYDAYYGVQNPWKKIQLLNSEQYMEIQNEAAANGGSNIPFPQNLYDQYKTVNTDWQDEMFYKNAPKESHTITMSGSGDKYNYLTSLSYYKQDGIMAKGKSNFERYTWRLNATKEMGILTVTNNVTYAHMKTRGIDPNDKFGVSLGQSLNLPSIIPAQPVNGVYSTPQTYGISMQEITNTNALLSVLNNETNTNKFVGGGSGTIDFGKLFPVLSGLKFKTSFSGELAFVDNRYYNPTYDFSATKKNLFTNTGETLTKYVTWNVDNVLTYDKTIGEHHFTGMLGHAAEKDWNEYINAAKAGLIFNDFDHAYVDNATDPTSIQAGAALRDEHTMLSYFGRLNYDFGNRYMFTAILRKDGSSRFGSDNKFGYFPSVSAGWVISRESFFPANTVLNFLKLRGSWGQNGSENIGNFAYTSLIGNGNIYYFGQTSPTSGTQINGTQPTRIANPKLKWETSDQKDFALDLGFLNDRITLTLDYYIKTTKDWLLDAPAEKVIGNVPPTVNGGNVENRGFEFELSLKQKISDFDVNVSFTGGFNKNEVKQLNNAEGVLKGGSGGFGQNDILRAEVGKPMGYFWGNKVVGVFQNKAEVDAYVDSKGNKIQPNAVPGDFKFADLNGDGKISDADRTDIGNPAPVFTGGVNLNVAWKGFDFYASFYSALGQKAWTAHRRYDQVFTNYSMDQYTNRWTGEGSTNSYPRVTSVDNNKNLQTPSDFYVHDASYLRLKNLTLGYTVPKSLTQKAKISKLRIYFSGENLFTFTKYPGYEPEIGGGVFSRGVDLGLYPQARSVIGGISVTF